MADVASRCYGKPMVSTRRNTFSFVGLDLLGCALVVPRSCPHAALSRRPCDVTGLLGRPPFAASALSRACGRAYSAIPERCLGSFKIAAGLVGYKKTSILMFLRKIYVLLMENWQKPRMLFRGVGVSLSKRLLRWDSPLGGAMSL